MGAWFYYGTLRDPDLFAVVAGADMASVRPLAGHVRGYSAQRIAEETYPGLRPQAGGQVEGVYASAVPPWMEARVRFYEEDEYHGVPITVHLADGRRVEAQVFMPNTRALMTEEAWRLERWRRDDKALALRLAAAWMSLFGHADPERLHDAWEALKASLSSDGDLLREDGAVPLAL